MLSQFDLILSQLDREALLFAGFTLADTCEWPSVILIHLYGRAAQTSL